MDRLEHWVATQPLRTSVPVLGTLGFVVTLAMAVVVVLSGADEGGFSPDTLDAAVLVALVVLAPVLETLLIAAAFLLLRRLADPGAHWSGLAAAMAMALLHAANSVAWALCVFGAFVLQGVVLQVVSRRSVWRGVLAVLVMHVLHNSYGAVLMVLVW